MAKRLIKWALTGSVLQVSKSLEDPKAIAAVEAEFDLAKIYPDFLKLTEVQRHIISYGARQNLMDTGASEIGSPDTKIGAAKKRWEEWLAGKVSGERVNATGAAAAKEAMKTLTTVRAAKNPEQLAAMQTLGFQLSADEAAIVAEWKAAQRNSKKGK